MATLQMEIDARGMRRGADEAARSLKDVERGAERAVGTVGRLGSQVNVGSESFRGFGSAAAGVSGVLGASSSFSQFSREITQIGSGLNSATNSAFAFSRGLLEVARVREDFANLNRETGKSSGLFGTLSSLVRANPLLAIATGIGAVGAAMSLFGQAADKTTEALDRQKDAAEALARAQQTVAERRALQQVRERIGITTDPQRGREAQRDFLAQQAAQQQLNPTPILIPDLARILELSPEATFRRIEQASRSGQGEKFPFSSPDKQGNAAGQFFTGGSYVPDLTKIFARPDAARLAYEQQARLLNNPLSVTAEAAPDRKQLDAYLESLRTETSLLAKSSDARDQAIGIMQAEQAARAGNATLLDADRQRIREEIELQQQLVQMRQLGQDVGQALGNGLLQAATGAQSLRSALAAVLGQLAQIAQSRAVAGFSNFLGNSFGATGLQSRSEIPGGIGPQQLQ